MLLNFIAAVLSMLTLHGPLIGESHGPVDVSPPETLNVLMHPTGDPVTRCLDMGGTPMQMTFCNDVDY
mgnify:CR=1 FL=1